MSQRLGEVARAAVQRSGACVSRHGRPFITRSSTARPLMRSYIRAEQQQSERFNPLDRMAVRRRQEAEIAHYKRRMKIAGVGLALSFLGVVATTLMFPDPSKPIQTEGPPGSPSFGSDSSSTTTTTLSGELVETGTSTIPLFPRHITLPAHESTKTAALPSGTGDADSEYTLLGLGIRTVSFLSIQVYVVGIYVATSDLAALQAAFVREAASTESASTLIANEKDDLRRKLLDHEQGEKIWERVLAEKDIRSVVRIVPTRNTDFGHLRDGFERNINGRVRSRPEMAEDDKLGNAVGDFKAMLGRGKLAKGDEVLLERGRQGELRAWFKVKTDKDWTDMGVVQDERISRLLLLGYLAGPKVASEPCRTSVVDGVLHVVERPIGTAETQVL